MLSQKAKYGLRALLYITKEGTDRPVVVREIAEKERLPRKFLEAILVELKDAGLLRSRPGKGGGYNLNRPAETIPLSRIIRVIDGPLAPIACVSQTAYAPCRDCLDEQTCVIRAVMKRVRDVTAEVLDGISLRDLARQQDLLSQKLPYLDFSI